MKCDELREIMLVNQVSGERIPSGTYKKAEVDAVIAELKAENARVKDDCASWKDKYNDCKRKLDLLNDTIAFYKGGKN